MWKLIGFRPFNKSTAFVTLPFFVLVSGCGSLQKNIDVPLPSYPVELVVECYLEPGMVPRLAVTESVSYLDLNNISPVVPTDVTVELTLPNGAVEPLRFGPGVDTVMHQAYTHVGRVPLVARPGDVFRLDVRDAEGRHVTGTATMPALVPIDSVSYKFNDRTGENHKAYVLTKFQDPSTPDDSYRLVLHKGNPVKNSFYGKPEVDYIAQDRLLNGQRFTLGTPYRFAENDTVTSTVYHIDEAFYRFRRSLNDARNANGNPFAQPSAIYSTVQGGLGIFTVLSYTRRTQILKP